MASNEASTAGLGGVHHVTAIVGDPARAVAFYAGVLGLRLVKRSVNYDDPSSWHLYFGDAAGSPGSVLTFFAHPHAARGRRGAGEACGVALSVPAGSLGYWDERLREADAPPREAMRFAEPALAFEDPDGLALELVERPIDGRPWAEAGVPDDVAIRAIEGVVLALGDVGPTEELLSRRLGYVRADVEVDQSCERIRMMHPSGGAGAHVDLMAGADGRASLGAGSIHHVAFRARDDRAQAKVRYAVNADGLDATEVRDRNYFRSIYFREPGGVLFEVATDGPGFLVDESPGTLGTGLRLPPWLEDERAGIARALPPLQAGAPVER